MDMKKSSPIILVAAAMYDPRKILVGEKEIYPMSNIVNAGLLGLATLLDEAGYSKVKMFQGKQIADIFREMNESGVDLGKMEHPILLSIPSFFAIEWANDFCDVVRGTNPDLKIAAGGRWTIDSNLDWIKKKMPQVNFFALGCSDDVIEKIVDPANWSEFRTPQSARKPFSKLNYRLLNDFQKYHPIIDIGRGCPNRCSFCLESSQKYGFSSFKSPQEIVNQIQQINEQYGENMGYYFMSSYFNPTEKWAIEFAELYTSNKLKSNWGVQARADEINPSTVEILGKAGLRTVDLGLESASMEQLLRMNKTKDPEEYLRKSEHLLKVISKSDTDTMLNLMPFPGETHKTLEETEMWLEKNKMYIKGVRGSPFRIFMNGGHTASLIKLTESLSGRKTDMACLEKNGFVSPDLSKEISNAEASEWCYNMKRKYNTANPKPNRYHHQVQSTLYGRHFTVSDARHASGFPLGSSVDGEHGQT